MKFVTIMNDDDYKSALDSYVASSEKENKSTQAIKASIGLEFKMGDIMYTIESIEEYVKCKQLSEKKEFPQTIYLEENQLKFVDIISKDDKVSSIQMPDKKAKKKEE